MLYPFHPLTPPPPSSSLFDIIPFCAYSPIPFPIHNRPNPQKNEKKMARKKNQHAYQFLSPIPSKPFKKIPIHSSPPNETFLYIHCLFTPQKENEK